MHPTHYCCPSSSTVDHAQPHISTFIKSVLSSAGFNKSSSQAIQLLTEVFERYLLLLASTSKHHSNHVGRRLSAPCDVERSLNELGTSTDDIRHWFDEEGGDIAGRWLEEEQDGIEVDRRDGSLPKAKMLGERQKVGKPNASESLTYHYRTIEEDERARLESILLDDADDESDADAKENDSPMQSLSPPPPYQTREQNGALPHPPTYKRRKLRASSVEYVPFFLPAFPDKEGKEDLVLDNAREADAEYEREMERRVQMGEDKKELLNETNNTGEDQQARARAMLDMAPASKSSVEDIWQSAIEFASSTLAQQQSIDDLPESIIEVDDAIARPDQESSHRIFANDYLALVSEQKSVPPALLTPSGSAFPNIFNQRRNLASILSDPSKYVPTDTIFASIDARPSATPFQPGPSLLITPPTKTNPAPTFTPLHASGRELISTSTITSALYPVCRHRIPNNALNASRYMSGGETGEIFRRVTRTLDPIPILDERHAERVFHGIQAPKEHLSDSHSYLREALDVLKVKRAEELKVGIENGTIDEEQSQLSLSASRDKLRVKSGTLVQTWDYMSRDYADAVLPGKKFRNGTPGVYLSTGTEGDQSIGS